MARLLGRARGMPNRVGVTLKTSGLTHPEVLKFCIFLRARMGEKFTEKVLAYLTRDCAGLVGVTNLFLIKYSKKYPLTSFSRSVNIGVLRTMLLLDSRVRENDLSWTLLIFF